MTLQDLLIKDLPTATAALDCSPRLGYMIRKGVRKPSRQTLVAAVRAWGDDLDLWGTVRTAWPEWSDERCGVEVSAIAMDARVG